MQLGLAARTVGGVEVDRSAHVRGVVSAASRLRLESALAAAAVVKAGAWHDVGYRADVARTGFHALDGAAYLRRLSAPEMVVCLVAYHSGAEYEAEERGFVAELAEFDRPPQQLLDALILVDMTTGPRGQTMTVPQRIAEALVRYPSGHPVHRALTRSQGYLMECAERAARATGSPEEWGFAPL